MPPNLVLTKILVFFDLTVPRALVMAVDLHVNWDF